MTRSPLSLAVKRGLTFLTRSQNSTGSFISHSSPTITPFVEAITYNTTFANALILGALLSLPDSQAKRLCCDRLSTLLLTQKSPDWSWNYWFREGEEAKRFSYPDDLDDTFASLSGLYRWQPTLFDGKAFAAITALLVKTEVDEGGPYKTWLISPQANPIWHDVDLAVNSNIAYFLHLQDIELPKLVTLAETAIKTRLYESPYYPSAHPIIYFLSRWYRGQHIDKLMSHSIALPQETPLQCALVISSLIRLKAVDRITPAAIERLLAAQRQDGSWPAEAFCLDPALGQQQYYAGASALTTAFCLEALSLYAAAGTASAQPDHSKERLNNNEIRQQTATTSEIDSFFRQINPQLADTAAETWRRLLQGELADQITGLPYLIAQSLKQRPPDITDELLHHLSLASLYGWMTYTISDDIIDEPIKPIEKLPVALIAQRQAFRHFNLALPKAEAYKQVVIATLNEINVANHWEIQHCRFSNGTLPQPDYGDYSILAHRSLGHALSALGVLYAAGFKPTSPSFMALKDFFHHYLIVRQLNDDAHDWPIDLEKGQVNSVAALILHDQRLQNEQSLEQIFWQTTILTVCTLIEDHLRQANQALTQLQDVMKTEPLYNLLQQYQEIANKTRSERQQTIDFLSRFN